jgi:hypothetical protein
MEALNVFELVQNLLEGMVSIVPNLLGALLTFFIGWLIAKAIRKLLKVFLGKLRIDRVGEYISEMDMFGGKEFQFSLVDFLSKFVYYFLMLIFLVAAADVLGVDAISNLLTDIINYIPNLFTALVLLVIGVILSDFLKKMVLTALESLGVPSAKLISGFIFYFLLINITLVALSQAQINTEFIAANISIIIGGAVLAFAIGYGLASRDIAANLINAFYWKDKFKIGDHIKIEEVEGEITRIEKSNIIVENEEGEFIVPMKKMSNHSIRIRRKEIGSDVDDLAD